MSSIHRSRSAPSVASPQPFLAPRSDDDSALGTQRPCIVRHKTSLALTDLSSPRSARSGYQTPCGERVEDPFSLGGFFPSHLAGTESPDTEWNWLRDDGLDVPDAAPEEAHDEKELPFEKAEDEETSQVIRREDKLGVLSLRSVFSAGEAMFTSAYDDHLLTPYSEGLPEDQEALYQTYCKLRRAHTQGTPVDAVGRPGGLFFADEGRLGDEGWWTLGLGRVLEMISL